MIGAVQQVQESFYEWWMRHRQMLIKVSVNDGPRAVADLAFTAGASFGLEMAKRAMAEAHADKDDPTEGNAA